MKNYIERFKTFIKESRQELRHVNWPTRNEAVRLTAMVVGLSLILAVFLGAFDYLFFYVIRQMVSR